MKLPAYPRTKPSSVEWLGDVPEHWEVKRLSYLATLKSGENITSEMIAEDGDYPVYGGNGLRGNYHKFTHRGHHALIGRQGALCGNINYASGEFWASEHALVVSPLKEFAVVWMGELLRAMNLGQYSVTAAQPGIAAEMIRGLRIPVPPLTEQHSIAAFLDRETGRVDRLVEKKRELIKRLKEKRTALISRTVTRGLPAEAAAKAGLPENSTLKPSGVEWLGEIPKHWEVVRLGRRIQLQRGVDITKDEQSEGTVPVVSSGGTASFHDTAFTHGPGVVVGRKGTVGAVYYVESDYWPHDTTLYVKEFRGNNPRYVFYKLCSMDLASFDTGSANPTLNRNLVHPVFVSWPPVLEQAAIAAYLDEETAKLDALVGKVVEAVERLQEYRTALITAAVTGKIDVRKATDSKL